MAEQIANRYIGVAGVVQRGHDVRSDKTGATGHQEHDIPCLDCAGPALPQSLPAGKWGGCRGGDDRARFAAFTCREGAGTDSTEWSLAPNGQIMNINSIHKVVMEDPNDTRPILIIPYMWIGDFMRGHSVVRVLKRRWPNRPVDLLVTSLCAPLVDYMPGVRSGIVGDLPRSRLAVARQWGLAAELKARNYGTALILPRTWKSAIAPALAGIPERVGFVGEARFGLLNRWRWGEKALPRFIDKNAALALPDGAPLPPEWPVPQLRVPAEDIVRWRQANGLSDGAAVALAPGSVGASKRWTYYPEAARLLAERGLEVWVVGGPGEKALAQEIVATGGARVRDLTGSDLRNGILAMAAAGVAISNDSGLMHIAAALGTPTMGIFGPTSPYLWAPLNGLAATVQTTTVLACQPCHRTVCTMNDHRCMREIPAADVVTIAERVLAEAGARVAH